MEQLHSLSLEMHDGPYEKWPPVSRLYVAGADTGKSVPGYVIEAQYKWHGGYLVITSQDCPYEESNDFLLLDNRFEIVAKAGLCAPYGTFLIYAHWPISDDALRIHYHDDLFYDLQIVSSPNRLPGRSLRQIPFNSTLRDIFDFWFSRNKQRGTSESRHDNPAAVFKLRVERFYGFRNDPACVASLRTLHERLEQIRQQISDA